MTSRELKIGWILEGNQTAPGARIQGFNIHRELQRAGVASVILQAPDRYSLVLDRIDDMWHRITADGVNILVFQKVYLGACDSLVDRCRCAGIRTVYLASDWCGANMMEECDAGIAVSSFLRDAFGGRLARKITVVPDALEVPKDLYKTDYSSSGRPLSAVYVGSSMPGADVLGLLSCIRDRVRLTVVSSGYSPANDKTDAARFRRSSLSIARKAFSRPWRNIAMVAAHRARYGLGRIVGNLFANASALPEVRFVPWDLKTVFHEIIQHDLAVIPCRLDSTYALAKSANRLTMFMALGMPVIASPVPAYQEIIRDGKNGFLAASNRGWTRAVAVLETAEAARRIGNMAREDVVKELTPETMAQRYLAVFRGEAVGS